MRARLHVLGIFFVLCNAPQNYTVFWAPESEEKKWNDTGSLGRWNYRVRIKSICPPHALLTNGLALEGPPTAGVHEAVQRENVVCDSGACRAGDVNPAFPRSSPGEGGEHRYYGLFCLMCYLLDVLATCTQTSLFFDSCLSAAYFLPLNLSLFSHLRKNYWVLRLWVSLVPVLSSCSFYCMRLNCYK